MGSHLLLALVIAMIGSTKAVAAGPATARYTRVDRLMADMQHVTTKVEESAFLRLVVGGDDGIFHVCIVADAPIRTVRMRGHYSDSTLTIAHGKFTYYHSNGRTESYGMFVKGTKSGPWTRWNVTGEQMTTKHYIGLAGDVLNDHLGLTSTARTLPLRTRHQVSAMTF